MDSNKLWTKDFIILCFSNFALSFSFYALLAVLPLYMRGPLGFPVSEIGPIMAAYTLGALLIRPFSGYTFDYFNKKKILLFSIFGFALLFLGYLYFNHAGMISVLRFIHGFTWGFITTGMVTVTVEIIPLQKRGQGIGYLGISMTLAMALGPPAAISAVKMTSFESLFLYTSLIAFVSFIIALFLKIKNPLHTEKHHATISIFVKRALPVSFSIMLFSISYGSIMSFITLYAVELEIQNAGRYFLFLALGLIITRLFSGKIFDTYGPRWISIVGFSIGIIGIAMLSFVHGEILFLFSALLTGLGFGSIVPAAQAMINNVVEPQKRGAANSTFLTFFDLGIGIGMIFTGLVSGMIGYRWSYFIGAVVSSFGLLFFLLFAIKYYFRHRIDQ